MIPKHQTPAAHMNEGYFTYLHPDSTLPESPEGQNKNMEHGYTCFIAHYSTTMGLRGDNNKGLPDTGSSLVGCDI